MTGLALLFNTAVSDNGPFSFLECYVPARAPLTLLADENAEFRRGNTADNAMLDEFNGRSHCSGGIRRGC